MVQGELFDSVLILSFEIFIKNYINRMGKNIQDKFTPIVPLQSYRCKERWGKMEDTFVSGKSVFQVI